MRYFIWALFIVLNPFYLFEAGNPQIGDILIFSTMVLSFGTVIHGYKVSPFKKRALIGFIAYTVLVNGGLFILYISAYRGIPFIASVFYLFNTFLLFFMLGLASKNIVKMVNYTQWGIFLSVFIQLTYFILFGSANAEELRPSFFFQTPNQLGYFAILMLSIFLLLNKVRKVNLVLFVSVFLICMFIALVSASKAAIGGGLFLVAFYLFDSNILKGYGLAAVIAIFGLSYAFLAKSNLGVQKVVYVLDRVDDGAKNHNVTEWEYRGYDRISNHPQYLILGAGEAMFTRFNTYIKKHEIHSSIGNIVFSYGIPGTILFGTFFLSLFKGLSWRNAVYILPVFLYSLTHMGLRFTPLWILFGVFPILAELKKSNKVNV